MPVLNTRRLSNNITLIFLALLLYCFFVFIVANEQLIAYVALFECILMVLLSRKDNIILALFVLLLWFNYSIFIPFTVLPIDNFFTQYRSSDSSLRALGFLFLFDTILCLLSIRISGFPIQHTFRSQRHHSNSFISFGSFIFLIFIFIFGIDRSAGIGVRSDPSPLYEYSVILFIIGYHYAGTQSDRKRLTILLLLFSVQNLILAGRITALQLVLVYYLVSVMPDTKVFKYLPCVLLAFLTFSIVGALRGSLFDGSIRDFGIHSILDQKFTLDTAYSAFHTSITFYKTEEIISVSSRILLLGQYIKYLVFGGEVPDSNLSNFTHDYYDHYYGGVLPNYCQFYLGIIGIVLISLYIGGILLKVPRLSPVRRYRDCLVVYVIATAPRWFLYTPTPLFRGVMFFSVTYGICFWFDQLCRKKVFV